MWGGGTVSRIGDAYYAQHFYKQVARAEGRDEGRIERVRAQMRTKCMTGVGYQLPRRIEMRDSVACDVFPPLGRGGFPRFVAPVRGKRGLRAHIHWVRHKADNAFGWANETQ